MVVVAVVLALATRMPLTKLVSTVEGGGNTLSFLALIMAFGAILGKMPEGSGGAQQIAQTLLRKAGTHNAPWVTGLLRLAVGPATVAMLGAAGIIALMLLANLSLHPVLVSLVIGNGAIGFVQFTDSLIWLGKECLSLGMGSAIKSISVATMLASILGLMGALLVNASL